MRTILLTSVCAIGLSVAALAQGLPGHQEGHYWLMQIGRDMLAFDLNNGQVASILSQAQNGSIPLKTALNTALAMDPHAANRCTAAGKTTSSGQVYQGFTVQPDSPC